MKHAERLELKAQVAVALASGMSAPRAAANVGVSADTVRKWRREPEMVQAVTDLKAITADSRGRDPMELVAAVEAVRARFKRPAAGPVVVSIPAGASVREQRRILARGIAQVLTPGRVR